MYLVLILKKTNVPLTNHTDANTENRRVLENIYIADRKKKKPARNDVYKTITSKRKDTNFMFSCSVSRVLNFCQYAI